MKLAPDDGQWARLRALARQAASYRNLTLRARWAEATGLRVDPQRGDPHDVTKHVRRHHKGELSGAAYSAAEREVQAVWSRDGRRILAGARGSEWDERAALSIRGHAHEQAASGVRLVPDGDGYVARLQVQAQEQPGGSWLAIPLARGKQIDDWQRELLDAMAQWQVPILRATVRLIPTRHRAILRLTYRRERAVPPAGQRVATLGPVRQDGRLSLRSETDTVDQTARLAVIRGRLDDWDAIRRRAAAQIGRRKGSARAKRRLFARLSPQGWIDNALHQWAREIVTWCAHQGVGRLVVLPLATGDWPAERFVGRLRYKASDAGIGLEETPQATVAEESTRRAVQTQVGQTQRKAKRVGDAVRMLRHALASDRQGGR